MKTRTISLALLAVATVASAKDDKISIVHAYKADQTEVYAVQVDQMLGTTKMTLTLKVHVKQVNQDGSADCELQALNVTRQSGDTASQSFDGKPFTARFDHTGALVSTNSALVSDPFIVGGPYGLDSGLVVGQTVPFDRQDPGGADVRLKGTAKLVSVADGFATVSATAERVDKKTGTLLHVVGTFTYAVKDWSLTKSDVTITPPARPHAGRAHIVSELQS